MREYDFPTVGTVLTASVQETLGTVTTTVDAISTTALIRELDRINRQFIRAAHTKHDNKGWSWMEAVYNFKTYASTTLNGSVSASAASIIVTSGTNFLSGGGQFAIQTSKGLIDFVTYTAKASNTLTTTASTVNVAHSDAEICDLLYDLPSDFAKEKWMIVNQSAYEYIKYSGNFPSFRQYTVYNGAILFPRNIGATDSTLVYDKQATDLNTGDESADQALSMDIPTDFLRYAIESLNAYIFMKKRRREDAQISMQLAEQTLRDALSYDINSSLNSGMKVSW